MKRYFNREWLRMSGKLWNAAPAAFALLCISAAPSHADRVWLASLDLSNVEQGWGKASADKSVDGHPITLGGRVFEHGLGTHSTGIFTVDLDRGSRRFTAWAGIDDETQKRGSVEFQVVGDGKILWSSGILRGGDPPKRVDVGVSMVNRLALIVGDAGDGFEYDHADWADASFDVVGAAPHSAKKAESNPSVAAPFEPNKPVITSPAIFGVRPQTPTLFTITATGTRPIKYSASGLPPGLKIDEATGRITGTQPVYATIPLVYNVHIKASNIHGSDSRTLMIVVADQVAVTPPLGWNSYDCFGDDVTEAEVMANARYVNEKLHQHGWEYIVVDYRWYDPNASKNPNDANIHKGEGLTMDANGRLTPSPNRFPSAEGGLGFKPLADRIHSMGLKFGIHVMRGITRAAVKQNFPIEGSPYHASEAANTANTCSWCSDMYGVDASKPAGQAWYDSLLRLYASWGVDYIKVDDMSSPYSTLEIEAVHKAIEKCGRSIVLSLSPGETPIEDARNVVANANLWGISGDFWDNWGAVNHQFDLLERWKGYGGPGHWPDADMIPLGHVSVSGRSVGPDRRTGLTKDEQMTMISLWALAPSPMMLGMNLPDNDPWTLSLISNDEVLAVNQDPLGKQALREPLPGTSALSEVWVRDMADGSKVVGLFNRIGVPMPIRIEWANIGIRTTKSVRDLWRREDLPHLGAGYETTLGPHGAILLRVVPGE